MTSGAEHYRYAEELAERVRHLGMSEREQRELLLQEAALHAGLAQVAATMYAHMRPSAAAEQEWSNALSEHKPVIQAEAEEPKAAE